MMASSAACTEKNKRDIGILIWQELNCMIYSDNSFQSSWLLFLYLNSCFRTRNFLGDFKI